MSDTPRMKAAQMTAIEHGTGDVWRVGCDLERELNAAKIEIEEKRKDVVWLATEKAKLEERIKQLEESENRMLNWLTEDCPEAVKKQLSNAWMKSKEAKP